MGYTTTSSTVSYSLDWPEEKRRKSCSVIVSPRSHQHQSWVPVVAPPSPPATPPELIDANVEPSSYFDEPAFRSFPGVTVAVIGTGYVGLHLVEAFSTAYDVLAFDISEHRIQEIQSTVASHVKCTSDPSQLRNATHFMVSVSTILNQGDHQSTIDISCIQSATQMIAKYARPGSTVIIESSVAVGMTRTLLEPLMKDKSLRCGMSPERVDPGRTYPAYDSIPKIISGLDEESLTSIKDLYSRVFQNLVPVSKPEVAEMTKLYENCQRMMCIAYANEMADACHTLSSSTLAGKDGVTVEINPWEIADAAATKPFGYMPCYPSLGVGGHCIPVNPYYLLSTAEFPLLEKCTKSMAERPSRIGDRVMERLSVQGTHQSENRAARILVVGMGFKRGQSVMSHSPGKALAVHLLSAYDVYLEYADPLVEQSAVSFAPRFDNPWSEEQLSRFDAIIVAVDQPGYDYEVLDRLQGTHVEWFCRR
ncbi:unnamed protein product [Zymoseptoria tritici ST99CH_1E4]|uniref:UDP-glucose/GDP-mannose dehydrogenase C-terminal domain-containing protein n=1 Tax=Zymoseptoria tritici ST99CH_1E4 TaxID=1276532 RepID=A0A2H1H851_ZYMTR|nr:unnamed protein product [Zymoseptoria tritici ST99CH_1E4]